MTEADNTVPLSDAQEAEFRRRVKAMRDDQLVEFVRDTITRLDALADRLEVLADQAASVETGGNARDA